MSLPTTPRYATTIDMWERLNVTSDRDEDLMTAALLAAEISIDTYCGRSFEVTPDATEARYFRARSSRFCRIDDTIDIATVETTPSTRASTFSTFGGEYVTWDCNGGSIDMIEADSGGWPSPRGWVKVTPTASWGWAAVPAHIAEATRIQAAKLYRRKDAVEGVMGFEGAGVVKLGRGLDVDVQTMLRGWVRREKVNP